MILWILTLLNWHKRTHTFMNRYFIIINQSVNCFHCHTIAMVRYLTTFTTLLLLKVSKIISLLSLKWPNIILNILVIFWCVLKRTFSWHHRRMIIMTYLCLNRTLTSHWYFFIINILLFRMMWSFMMSRMMIWLFIW